MHDLVSFCEKFDRDSKAFDRLLFVMRLLDLRQNPIEGAGSILDKFYSVKRKTLILV